MNSPLDWRLEESEELIRDDWLNLRADRCRMPDGTEVTPYYVLEYPDWVNVVALTEDDELVMIRQYRHGVGRTLLEIPCGSMDSGDASPLDAARRELLEETGFECTDLRPTASMFSNASSHTNQAHMFVGTNAKRVSGQRLDASEQILVELVPLADVYARLDSNELFPTSMQMAIYAGLRALGRIRFD